MKQNKKLFYILILLFFIVIITIGVYYINTYENTFSVVSKSNLKDYDKLKQEISLISATQAGQTPDYQKMVRNIAKLENNKLSKNEQREILYSALNYLIGAYSANNDHRLYTLQIDLHNFIILNFPDDKKNNFIPLCFDQDCADNKPSQEISNIIEQIKTSQLPEAIKENDIKNLTNYNYLTDASAELKVTNFLIVANMIKESPDYIKLGINIKIYNQIIDYLKSKYPVLYEKISKL